MNQKELTNARSVHDSLLTMEEMAEVLNVQKSWLYTRTKLGQKGIPHSRVGKHIRFNKQQVLDFFAKAS